MKARITYQKKGISGRLELMALAEIREMCQGDCYGAGVFASNLEKAIEGFKTGNAIRAKHCFEIELHPNYEEVKLWKRDIKGDRSALLITIDFKP